MEQRPSMTPLLAQSTDSRSDDPAQQAPIVVKKEFRTGKARNAPFSTTLGAKTTHYICSNSKKFHQISIRWYGLVV
jgi:hypothetical protein